jgi:hypothetical protein
LFAGGITKLLTGAAGYGLGILQGGDSGGTTSGSQGGSPLLSAFAGAVPGVTNLLFPRGQDTACGGVAALLRDGLAVSGGCGVDLAPVGLPRDGGVVVGGLVGFRICHRRSPVSARD